MSDKSQHPSFAIAEADLPYLAKVKPDFAKPIQLLHFEKMNYREIAADLGIPIGTVRSRIHRGRAVIQRLRDEAAEQHETFQAPTLPQMAQSP